MDVYRRVLRCKCKLWIFFFFFFKSTFLRCIIFLASWLTYLFHIFITLVYSVRDKCQFLHYSVESIVYCGCFLRWKAIAIYYQVSDRTSEEGICMFVPKITYTYLSSKFNNDKWGGQRSQFSYYCEKITTASK